MSSSERYYDKNFDKVVQMFWGSYVDRTCGKLIFSFLPAGTDSEGMSGFKTIVGLLTPFGIQWVEKYLVGNRMFIDLVDSQNTFEALIKSELIYIEAFKKIRKEA